MRGEIEHATILMILTKNYIYGMLWSGHILFIVLHIMLVTRYWTRYYPSSLSQLYFVSLLHLKHDNALRAFKVLWLRFFTFLCVYSVIYLHFTQGKYYSLLEHDAYQAQRSIFQIISENRIIVRIFFSFMYFVGLILFFLFIHLLVGSMLALTLYWFYDGSMLDLCWIYVDSMITL